MGLVEDHNAQEEARKKALEEERRGKVYIELGILNAKVIACEAGLSLLNASRNNLSNEGNEWSNTISSFRSSQIVQNIEVKNKFEGISAASLKKILPEGIKQMNQNKVKMDSLISILDSQISKVNTYIEDTRNRIRALNASL